MFPSVCLQNIVKGLKDIGHKVHLLGPADGFAAAVGLLRKNGTIEGATDNRRSGQVCLIP